MARRAGWGRGRWGEANGRECGLGEANGWESPGARGWGRSQTRKAVGAGSQADNLSSPLRDELGHAPLVVRRPRPARPCGWPWGPAAPLPLPARGGGGGADTCRPQARSNLWAAGGCLARGPALADPLGAGSAVSDAGRGLAEAHGALLDAEGSGLPRSPVLHSNPTSAEGPATTIVRPTEKAYWFRPAPPTSQWRGHPGTVTQRPLRFFAQSFSAVGTAAGPFSPLAYLDDANVPTRHHDAVLTMHNSVLPNCTHLKVTWPQTLNCNATLGYCTYLKCFLAILQRSDKLKTFLSERSTLANE